ncbi:MAG TPA: alpha/beta hydrolase [Actinomycetota bacterium]|nr:alpha/beta hydrolase [Actinomycetota bacterium]
MSGWDDGRRRRRLVLAALVPLLVAGCGSPPPASEVTMVSGIAYTSGAELDVHARAGVARQPVLVLLHGCCGSKDDLTPLAEAIAARGAVVFNADWTGVDRGGGWPRSYQEAACAVRFARASAARFGGDPGRIALLGWSDGALLAAVVAVAGDDLGDGCPQHRVSALPDVLIGVAGFYGWPVAPGRVVNPRYVNARTIRFFGGPPAEVPRAWAAGNPYTRLGGNRRLEARLVAGDADALLADGRRFLAALQRAGYGASLRVVDEGNHRTVVAPRTPPGRLTVEEAFAAASGATPASGTSSNGQRR